MKKRIALVCCCFVIGINAWLLTTTLETTHLDDNETTTEQVSTEGTNVDVTIEDLLVPGVQSPMFSAGVLGAITQPPVLLLPTPDTSVGTEELETEVESEIEETEDVEEKVYYCQWGDFYLTEDDYKLLLTTTFCESGGEPAETQYMVALTILNRLVAGMGGDTIRDVVYAKNAFSVVRWKDFENRGWTERVEQSVQKALETNPHPRNMYYFRTGHYHSWAKNYKKVGKVYFSTKK